MRKQRKANIDVYNTALLADPMYTPNRVINMVMEHLYPGQEVANRTIARILDIDNCTMSRVLSRHVAFSPRMVLCIMDATGWTREQFNQYSGMKPYVNKLTPEQLQDLRSRKGKMAESIRPGNQPAVRENGQYTTAWKDPD